ncbi:MAG: family 10 glycosylhydrolase [Candidatus Gastranaerophilales bacterium]|nr:family 10 glycosylhydrolase [Candidatus Gastranaerophilales bacterium]
MKNLVKSIILGALCLLPLSVAAQEGVLKSYTAPYRPVQSKTTTIIRKSAVKQSANKKLTVQANKKAAPNIKKVATTPAVSTNKQSINIVNTKPVSNTQNITNQMGIEDNTVKPIFPIVATQPPVEFVYKEAARNISAIDPSVATGANSYFPGLRGANQLVIYTPQYGIKTGTNEFGTEAIVYQNTVIQLNGADSLIPTTGFVISGHGSAKNWINENISIGSKIYIDTQNKKIKSYLTQDSLIFAAKEKIKEANSLMQYYSDMDILYNDKKATMYINKSKDLLRKAETDNQNAQILISDAMEAANMAIKNAIPYKADELKGVWIRPIEKSPDEIVKTVQNLDAAGINNIFLETYFHGKTIFPSKVLNDYNVTNQREEFVGFDPLRVWIDECHKRGIKVNIWFETFYVGNQNPVGNTKHVLNVHPDWANTTKAGYASNSPVASLSEHNGYFIDPANPAVQDYLLDLLKEIITKYRPDGINLDYIRYPQSIAAKFPSYDMSNWGYTQYARDEFKNLYNVDPVTIKYGTESWDLWARYRQDKITDFVKEVRKITKPKNILLTTVVFPDRQKALETKMQDWKSWSTLNIIDGYTPLLLTSDTNTASNMLSDIKMNSQPCTKVYAGLFVTFMGGSIDDLLMQIQESRKLKANGVIMFDYAHLDNKYVEALQARVFKPEDTQTVKTQTQQCSKKSTTVKTKKKKKFRKKCENEADIAVMA